MEQSKRVELSAEVNDVFTYALQQNGLELVRQVTIKNTTDEDIENVIIRIHTDIDLAEPFEQVVQTLRAGEEMELRNLNVRIKGQHLASLTERVAGVLFISVFQAEELLAKESRNVIALAYDEWPGLKYFPDLLAAFITPNHPVVASMLQSASGWLNKWTGRPSLEGYQSESPNRVKQMAAAIYAAIQEKNIAYAVPPSSFEEIGQRVRLCETVVEQHLGTCMDMTLLYAACLEAMGLNPVVILMRGHIFAGVWLIEESFADPIEDDPSQLEKRMAAGIHELLVVECTSMCSGKTTEFDTAITIATASVGDYPNFIFAIDVMRARKSGIRPLPVRIKTDAGYVVEHAYRKEEEVTGAPEELGDTFVYESARVPETITKQTQWERKLLDLSLRNMLINMRLTKAVIPMLSVSVGDLEDALADGEEFQVLPRPLEWDMHEIHSFHIESTNVLGPYKELIALECRHRRLHSIYTEKELNSCLTKMYRSAKTSLEENGVSTLYLALGLLRWFEEKGSTIPRYAPIIMIPIDIVRKSASKGYVLRMRDEDAQLNITLLEFLKQNFNIVIHGLNPIPMDDHGVDINKIFAIIRRGVMEETMWDIIESGFIGNFSFSQFVMWNDIHNKTEFLKQNKVVRSLMNGAVDWDCSIQNSVDTEEAYLPITADASQLRAINMAAGGVSFVLHGPPGTGKSQTITAMIANALTKGKNVLFVAEKMAALEVVQKRLTALGIGAFCLELHSNKSTKKNVLDQLRRVLEISADGLQTDYDKKIEDIRNMRRDLDAYVKALHQRRPFGYSLRELIDIYEFIHDHGEEIYFERAFVSTLTRSDLDNHMHALERLLAVGRSVGHPHGHPLSAVKQTVYSQSLKMDFVNVVSAYKEALIACKYDIQQLSEQLGLTLECSKAGLEYMHSCAKSVLFMKSIPPVMMDADSLEQVFATIQAYQQKKFALNEKKAQFCARWNQNFLRMDMAIFRKRFEEANMKFFGKKKALAVLTAELQAYASFPVITEQIPVLLTDIVFYQKELEETNGIEDNFSQELREIAETCQTKEALESFKEEVKQHLLIAAPFIENRTKQENSGKLYDCFRYAKAVAEDWTMLLQKEVAAKELLWLSFHDMEEDWADGRIKQCDTLLSHVDAIKEWIVYRQSSEECRAIGLSPVCTAYESGLSHEVLLDVYLKSMYKAIARNVIEQEPVLNGFTGSNFHERIQQFKKLDEEFIKLTKDEMYYKLTHQLPTGYESTEMSKELHNLRRAISSNGRGLSIRALFEQLPQVLQKLVPCMLMSPISAAQYLTTDKNLFDIVIFDEASQLPTCKAVGVMARGENVVIVGDPNQMPPTSFFAGSKVDEDNLDIEDLDSILDDCLALGMPQAHLKWHYRSKHESLIAFSNREFYENQMLTFPSVNDRERRVRMVQAEGFFDRGKGRVNEGEAKAIVKEIKRRYANAKLKNLTIGVVTFNITQQTFIEDLLQEEFQKDPEFDRWASQGEEPLFVKNLENVQGDERDIILFSVSFGADAEGKLSLNFGPLNKEGGWKRLNVAVSRARYEMIIFTTMTADMINLKRTKSKGVEALKNFLQFAETGRLQLAYTSTRSGKTQGIMERICRVLTEQGYEYQTFVGHSNFKVDIAAVNPYEKAAYLLGILLDGESYAHSVNTKDREVSQISVLNGLGWKLHRIWSMDWWDNKDKEIARLLEILDKLKEDALHDMTAVKAQCTEQKEAVTIVEEALQEEVEQREPTVVPDDGSENILPSMPVLTLESNVMPKQIMADTAVQKIAGMKAEREIDQSESVTAAPVSVLAYEGVKYVSADTPLTPLKTAEFVSKECMELVKERLLIILESEAPISFERLLKKTLRSFGIGRASEQTIEVVDKVLKEMPVKCNRQNGVKFYWNVRQVPEEYRWFRLDGTGSDKRSPDEICQQELKNAICRTLQDKAVLDKEGLIRETVRTMGYARSGTALAEAVERGLAYGRKTGEIMQTSEKKFTLP